jgi:dienelactone hydrolase
VVSETELDAAVTWYGCPPLEYIDASKIRIPLQGHWATQDAHFTPDELPEHKGWGHASWHQVAEFAGRCGAEHLWLFHHKPGRTDQQLADIEAEARRVFPATTVARERAEFTL